MTSLKGGFIDDFLKRLWQTCVFYIFSFNLIHFLMWVNGGYSKNWLFILTSKLIWLEFWAIKITAVGAVGFSSWWFFKTVKDSVARSEANQKEQLRIVEHNKKAAAYNALHEGYRKTAEANQIRDEMLRKEEFKKQQELLKFERTGPRKEADALKKALEGINYGGLS